MVRDDLRECCRGEIRRDGLKGALLGAIFGEDTVYADEYSHDRFAEIELGMSEKEVYSRIGPPISTWQTPSQIKDGEHSARWSYSPGDTHFRGRIIQFKEGRVIEKHSEFYID